MKRTNLSLLWTCCGWLAATQAQTPLYTFVGDAPDDRFGVSAAQVGDLNGDGVVDLIIGAQFDDDGGVNAGGARVFSGADGSVLFTFHGDSASAFFGAAVSPAGDVNGDDVPDILIGGFGDDSFGANSGMARVLSGADGAILHTFHGDSSAEGFGSSVAGVGDVNGDGVPDILAGSVNDTVGVFQSGSAKLFSGQDGSLLHVFSGESINDLFGVSVANAGDLNGDGVNEMMIGASFTDINALNAGAVYVYSGSDFTLLYRFEGDSVGGNFGTSVSGAGDVNGDGVPDLIIGARNDAPFGVATGSAFVFSGADGVLLHQFVGAAAGDSFGRAVASAGDANGDGFTDLIVGAIGEDTGGVNAGSAMVFSGFDGAVLATLYGTAAGGFLGASVSGAGDLNGDGFDEVVAGASAGNTAIVYSLASPDLVLGGLANIVVALDLNPGLANSLLSKVDAALAKLEDANPGSDEAAIHILEALLGQIEAQRGKALTDAEADRLRDAVLRVIELLSD
jgi:hypothetical protein